MGLFNNGPLYPNQNFYAHLKKKNFVFQQLAHPRHDEWNRFVYTLQELKSNQTDEEMEKLSGNAASGPSSLSSLASIASR